MPSRPGDLRIASLERGVYNLLFREMDGQPGGRGMRPWSGLIRADSITADEGKAACFVGM
jgi:hypothetical protein